MKKLENKRALVTGGTSGIGLATAKLFHEEGARVLVTGRNDVTLAAARRELPADIQVVKSDARSLADGAALAKTIAETFGGLDVAFLNAGAAKFAPLEGVTEGDWDEAFAVNVKGPYFLAQKLAPLFASGGALLFNTSVVDVKGFASTSVYSATKAALRSLVRTLAAELAPRGVRVNAVAPGPIATPIYGKLGFDTDSQAGFEKAMADMNPMKRFGLPDEVARAALFLASTDSSYITGADLTVDGGLANL